MATKIQSLTVPARDKAEHDCHCGCASCEATCCSLDCIVKPRFFCGQLLTDADLSAMLKWARDRFGLSRYRHGWGVVCGLDVRCDPGAPTSVIVTPGYAVNCCGDDVIVCETATLDLKGACKAAEDPCADLRRERDSLMKPGGQIGGKIGDAIGREGRVDLRAGARTGETLETARVVDVYVSYTEQPTDPSTALGRSSCKQTPECEYSRTRESYKLSWEIGIKENDPISARARTWHEGYEKCLEVLTTFRQKFNQSSPAGDVRKWLLRWIDEHPQYQLCGLRERLCRADDDFFITEKNLVETLFLIVQGCRNAYLQCECFGCDEDTRVALARVWLTPDNGMPDSCRILAIDPYPPYRRPIQPECWPAPLGSVNVGRFIWHRREEVCRTVHDLGMKVTFGNFQLPTTLNELQQKLNCNLFVGCDEQRTALLYDAGPFGSRVVGFCDGGAPQTPECPTITVVPEVNQVTAGTPAKFRVQLQPDAPRATFVWAVDGGTISAGQGTAGLTVDTTGLTTRPIVATVTVVGLDPACNKTAEGRTFVTANQPLPCPTIKVVPHAAQVPDGATAEFTVELVPDVSATLNLRYSWTVGAGTITSGQGTRSITVDTTGLGGEMLTAAVEVGGLDPNCPRTGAGSTLVIGEVATRFSRKVGEFFDMGESGNVNDPSTKLLAEFASQIQNDPTVQGFIIAHGGVRLTFADISARRAQDFVVNRHGVDPSRLVAKAAADNQLAGEAPVVELWIVPPGAALPSIAIGRRADTPDDLTMLKGIGPSRLKLLNDSGIKSFADLAAADPNRLKELIPTGSDDDRARWITESKKRAG